MPKQAASDKDQALTDPTNGGVDDGGKLEDGVGLCLSGGGYRAMLFHLGTLWRLHEGGLLWRLDRISSVSGGSITAAVTALAWDRLQEGRDAIAPFVDHVVTPVRELAGRTIDKRSIIRGLLLPGSISDQIVRLYRQSLFGEATLQDLPDQPRFVINATSLQTGTLWRFSKPYMGNWQVGRIMNPTTSIAEAVAASSAFPPFLSPRSIRLDPASFTKDPKAPLQRAPFTSEAILSDGGVYDNLGLETVWKRYRSVLVSDAGMKIDPTGAPPTDWAFGSKWVTDIVDGQVRALRKRQLLGSLTAPAKDPNGRSGAYWSIRSRVGDYPAPSSLDCPAISTDQLAAVPTRLAALPGDLQERLINWGYAMCDVAVRSWFDQSLSAAPRFPYAIGV